MLFLRILSVSAILLTLVAARHVAVSSNPQQASRNLSSYYQR